MSASRMPHHGFPMPLGLVIYIDGRALHGHRRLRRLRADLQPNLGGYNGQLYRFACDPHPKDRPTVYFNSINLKCESRAACYTSNAEHDNTAALTRMLDFCSPDLVTLGISSPALSPACLLRISQMSATMRSPPHFLCCLIATLRPQQCKTMPVATSNIFVTAWLTAARDRCTLEEVRDGHVAARPWRASP